MPPTALADLIDMLEEAGELERVAVEVDPHLEIAAITARIAAQGGPALLFTRAGGHQPPVLTNLLGSESRLCRALEIESLDRLSELLDASAAAGESWFGRLKRGAALTPTEKNATRLVRHAVCQQVVKLGRDVDMAEWPALRSWPKEPRLSLTAGRLLCRFPDGGPHSIEDPMLEVVDRATLGIAWHRYHRGWQAFEAHRARGEAMPVALWLGGAAGFAVTCAAPLAGDADGFAFSALLMGGPVEVVKCRSHDLMVPAHAEIVLEGYIDPETRPLPGGGLAQANGHYGQSGDVWPLQVTTVTHRTNPIFPAVVLGMAPGEAGILARAVSRLWLPLVRATIPELVDYHLPEAAGPKNLAILSIRKQWPQQAHKVAAAFWGLDAFMHTKMLIVVDEQVDAGVASQVALAVGANVHPGRDIFFHQGPGWPLDHAAGHIGLAHAVGIDATAKLPEEHGGPWSERLACSPEMSELLAKRWREYGLK
jgi:4-hydroxy-3-polyprenylbenzoate decarboxylase